ncbi:MAG TPA: ABC transporter permease [Galbitalea sp.]
MSGRNFLTVPRLVGRRFAINPLASILVGVLVLITAFVAAAVPRLVEKQNTAELAYQLGSIGEVSRSLSGTSDFPEYWADTPSPTREEIYGELDTAFTEGRSRLPQPLRSATGAAQWVVQTDTIPTTLVNGSPGLLGLRLTADEYYLSRVRIVAGAAPAVWGGNDAGAPSVADQAPIDILLSTTAAKSLHVGVGDIVGSRNVDGIPSPSYRVTGLFEPKAPAAQFWRQNPSLVPAFLVKPDRGPSYLAGAAFINPLSLGRLGQTFANASISLYYPVSATTTDGADADALRSQLSAVLSEGISLPGGESRGMSITTGSVTAVIAAQQRDQVLSGFLALLASAPLGVTLAVLGLGVQAVIRSRRRDIALTIARGAKESQVRAVVAVEGLVLAVPGVAVVTLLATLLLPTRPDPSDFILPGLVAIAPAVLFAALAIPRDADYAQARRARQLRIIAEIAVLLLAVLALFLLARRGLAQSSAAVGIDPLLVATPLLLSVSVGILVLRGYPIPLLAARRRAIRARGLAGFVGSIRATRSPTVGLVGVLALVVGISIAIFSTVMLSTFDGSTIRAAQESVGADVRADAAAFTPTERSAVVAVPGVTAVAGVEHLDPRSFRGMGVIDTVNVMVAQTSALRSLRPGLASGLNAETDGRIPVIVSSDLAAEVHGHADETLDGVPVRIAGILPADSKLGLQHSWMLVDSAFAKRFTVVFTPDLLLIKAQPASLDGIRDRVARVAGPGATVSTVASVADARRAEPAVAGVRLAVLLGALISVLLCTIALVLSTIVAGRARARTAGILRTLGLPSRSLRVLVAWELVPVVLVAVIAGTILGALLPFLLTAAVDLRPFTGDDTRPVPLFDFGLVGIVLAAFCVVVAIVGFVAVAAGERLNPSTALKMGAL